VSENWISATLLLTPVIGTYQYVSRLLLSSPSPTNQPVAPRRGDLGLPARSGWGSIDYPNSFTRIRCSICLITLRTLGLQSCLRCVDRIRLVVFSGNED
jgi:hypothetical protein